MITNNETILDSLSGQLNSFGVHNVPVYCRCASTPCTCNLGASVIPEDCGEDRRTTFSNTYKTPSSAPVPSTATSAVLQGSCPIPRGTLYTRGPDFDTPPTLDSLLDSYLYSGFQATQLGRAIIEVNRMIDWKAGAVETSQGDGDVDASSLKQIMSSEELARRGRCTIWLSFTSNLISSGLREVFCFLAKHQLVDIVVTSAGGVEEDFVKCLGSTAIGDFSLNGSTLRSKGWNRIGNLLVPNDNYCKFEDWIQPILDKMAAEQKEKIQKGVDIVDAVWSPSEIIDRLGEEVNNEESVFYWCHKNKIPVFCPGLTDGSLGDNLFFHSYRNRGLICDVVKDIRRINDLATHCSMSGMIILGGGVPKHHTCNANLMRNGADFAVYINTGVEFDGSDSGARPDEAVSWGKIKTEAEPVKVHGDATIIFPLLVAATFAKKFHLQRELGPK